MHNDDGRLLSLCVPYNNVHYYDVYSCQNKLLQACMQIISNVFNYYLIENSIQYVRDSSFSD